MAVTNNTSPALRMLEAEARVKAEIARLQQRPSDTVDMYMGEPVHKALNAFLASGEIAKAEQLIELMQKTLPMPPARPAPPPLETKPDLWAKLCMRMGWKLHGITHRVPNLKLVEQNGKVFVFGVIDGNPFTIEDTTDMFPSDQVVTQLRILNVTEG